MQIFELHFNPKNKEGKIFDSFVYEPENIYEKRLGSLYMVGMLKNALPQNSNFLDNLARAIKEKYYTLSFKSPEKALSEGLKRANEVLSEEVKKENVSWLGNLNFAVLSLKDFNLTFTKTGNLKILLLREDQIIDMGKNLDLQEIEPYPLKIFFNIVSGKLALNDIILVLTREVFDFFLQENLLSKLSQTDSLDRKKIKEIFPRQLFTKGEGLKISGTCFLAVLKEGVGFEEEPKEILFQKERRFSMSEALSPLFRPFQKIWHKSLTLIKKPAAIIRKPLLLLKLPQPSKKKKKISKKKISFPKIKFPSLFPTKKPIKVVGDAIERFQPKSKAKRKLTLIFLLALSLSLGFLIFKGVEKKGEGKVRASLEAIQKKVLQAENFLIFKEEEKADALFKEAWQELQPLIEKESSLNSEVLSLQGSIEESLEKLNKLEKIESPELLVESDPSLFSSPSDSLVDPPPFEFNFDLSASYLSNLYFLDKKTCEVIKYPHLGGSKWGSPQKWMKDKGPCSNPKSMAIDGSIWVLEEDNAIDIYHKGVYQKTINLDIFPFPENITKIKTKPGLPYLYLLEPTKKRIILIDKEGEIFKQFQSEKFDNLKDFDVSKNGKTIWLLNNLRVYKIEL